jgi:hypothetical protein
VTIGVNRLVEAIERNACGCWKWDNDRPEKVIFSWDSESAEDRYGIGTDRLEKTIQDMDVSVLDT